MKGLLIMNGGISQDIIPAPAAGEGMTPSAVCGEINKKSGYKTAEFAAAIGAMLVPIISIFVMMGKITPEEGNALGNALTIGLGSLATALAAIVPAGMFIWSRVKTKQHLINAMQSGICVKNFHV